MRRLSLRTRLLLGVVSLAALGLVVADVATYRSLSSYLIQRVDATLEQAHPPIEQAVFSTQPPYAPNAYGAPGQILGDCVRVEQLNGSPVGQDACHGPLGMPSGARFPSPVHLPARPNTPEGERVTYLTVPPYRGSGNFRVRASVEPRNPDYVLLIAQWLGPEESTLHRLFRIELFVSLVVLAALAGLAFWIIQIGLRPLRAIEATAVAITAGDLSLRVEQADDQTEVGRLGAALNTMLDRIEASDKRLRRFVADASHELRTPLAAVRAYAELFGRGSAAHPEDLERSMTGITRESERMSLLVDDLFLLARLDEGRPLVREPVDLTAVVSEAVDAARVMEPERPIDVGLEPATITGDDGRLRQVVDNLFANVRAHTPAGTPVSVELRTANGQARLTVADHGPGLAEDDAARIFERFYRVDTSRARASGGVGLGLSIVAAVVAAHGGSVAAEETPGGGATFVIALPLAS
jgi:two-component system, OmpR family, sensor kinase